MEAAEKGAEASEAAAGGRRPGGGVARADVLGEGRPGGVPSSPPTSDARLAASPPEAPSGGSGGSSPAVVSVDAAAQTEAGAARTPSGARRSLAFREPGGAEKPARGAEKPARAAQRLGSGPSEDTAWGSSAEEDDGSGDERSERS